MVIKTPIETPFFLLIQNRLIAQLGKIYMGMGAKQVFQLRYAFRTPEPGGENTGFLVNLPYFSMPFILRC